MIKYHQSKDRVRWDREVAVPVLDEKVRESATRYQ